ncbi:MAG TPA: hypothetical protein VKV95_04150 [Terriglobia bacterium]|nr:hypothetical protein [Terriglobia bacterium]
MWTNRMLTAVFLFAASVGVLFAKNKWDGAPFQQWNQETVSKLFNDSPWAQEWTHKNVGVGGGVNEQEFTFSVRVFSSEPIREAYVRMLQILNKYDSMPPDQKTSFDGRVTTPLLNADVKDQVVLAVAYKTNDQSAQRDLRRFFDNATTDTLNQQAYVFSPQLGRVDLLKYISPGSDGIGARFIYPRTVNGKPLLQPGDKELRFEFWVGGPVNDELRVAFDGRKMIYKDELSY